MTPRDAPAATIAYALERWECPELIADQSWWPRTSIARGENRDCGSRLDWRAYWYRERLIFEGFSPPDALTAFLLDAEPDALSSVIGHAAAVLRAYVSPAPLQPAPDRPRAWLAAQAGTVRLPRLTLPANVDPLVAIGLALRVVRRTNPGWMQRSALRFPRQRISIALRLAETLAIPSIPSLRRLFAHAIPT